MDAAFNYCRKIGCTKFQAPKTQNFKMKPFQIIICKKHWKNCASSEQAVTTSKTLTEYRMKRCTAIGSNNCNFKTYDLGLKEIQELG